MLYLYSKTDSKHEIIGRVKATGLFEAREQISKIKQLNHSIDNLDDRINYFNNEISDVHERISDVDEDIQRQLDSRLDKLEDKDRRK